MSFRFLRNFIAGCMFTFIVVSVWHLYQFNHLSLSSRDAGIDAVAAVLITLVHFLGARLSLSRPMGKAARPRGFLAQAFLRLAGLYLILIAWSGASYELVHHSFSRQDLWAILTSDLRSAPLMIIFVFWVISSEWWSAYAFSTGKAVVPAASSDPLIAEAPVPIRREKPAFLTLDIYPKR
jgi:hypothetical protein